MGSLIRPILLYPTKGVYLAKRKSIAQFARDLLPAMRVVLITRLIRQMM